MKIFLISISVVSSILMIIAILLQQGKGADLGAAFGRGAQGGLFTTSGKANFLTRITSILVTVFLVSALALSVFLGSSQQDGVLEELGGEDIFSEHLGGEEDVIYGQDEEAATNRPDIIIENNEKNNQTPD